MVAIISHDSGGAEILSSWVRKQTERYCLVLDGPAEKIFRRKLGDFVSISLSLAIKKCDWILCGTSWQSNLERQAISFAKAANKKVVAFLDHWVNYRERFWGNESYLFPDEIWVGDADAEKLAQTLFPAIPIVLKPNPYFEDLRMDMQRLQKMSSVHQQARHCSVLYVCEPVKEHALLQYGNERYWGYSEEEALEYFLKNTAALGSIIDEIRIRPHPSEKSDKYDWVKHCSPFNIQIGGKQPLFEEIAQSDVVVGCESMALVIGLISGKRVISCIPPGGTVCRLPQREIEHLSQLIENGCASNNA